MRPSSGCSCAPDVNYLPQESYKQDTCLAFHEVLKHATCSGLSATAWMEASKRAYDLVSQTGGFERMTQIAQSPVRTGVDRSELYSQFGNEGGVSMSCDSNCNIKEVFTCWVGGPDGQFTGIQSACPDRFSTSNGYSASCEPCDRLFAPSKKNGGLEDRSCDSHPVDHPAGTRKPLTGLRGARPGEFSVYVLALFWTPTNCRRGGTYDKMGRGLCLGNTLSRACCQS